MQRLEFRAMGSRILVVLDLETPNAHDYLGPVPGWFATWEQHLSRFRADSELNQLNQSNGTAVSVSPVLWDVLQQALCAAQQSEGLVTPTLLDALEVAGYDRSFGTWPLAGATDAHLNNANDTQVQSSVTAIAETFLDWHAIECDPVTATVRLPVGMRLDLGGTGKGWAAEQAMQRLAVYGPVLVDAGGDIAVSGCCADGSPWPIGVADPTHPERQLELLLLPDGGVATSGRDYRRWQMNGSWQHHILDPRTGRPAVTDLLSATVIAPTVTAAEAAAKVALILGSDAALAWLDARPSLAGLLVREDGDVLYSRRMGEYLWRAEEPVMHTDARP